MSLAIFGDLRERTEERHLAETLSTQGEANAMTMRAKAMTETVELLKAISCRAAESAERGHRPWNAPDPRSECGQVVRCRTG